MKGSRPYLDLWKITLEKNSEEPLYLGVQVRKFSSQRNSEHQTSKKIDSQKIIREIRQGVRDQLEPVDQSEDPQHIFARHRDHDEIGSSLSSYHVGPALHTPIHETFKNKQENLRKKETPRQNKSRSSSSVDLAV